MSQVRTRPKLSILTALVTLLTVLVFPTSGAFAADIGPIDCVTPDLQTAINAANPGDTIIITDATTCTGNFAVNKQLTIRAATAAGATLDGGLVDGSPVVDVVAGGDLTLQDLTISGGLNSLGDGGGIRSSAAVVTLVDSTVTGNSAVNGAGIWTDGTLTVTGSLITNNTASQGGGGIHNISGGSVTVSASTISNNTAEHAAGILNNGAGGTGSTTVLTDSFVTGNDAVGTDGDPAGGGGIYNFSFPLDVVKAQLTLNNTEVSTNTSAEGAAGIRNADSEAAINESLISGNDATGTGGGIRTSGTMTVIDSAVLGNTASTSGGGIALDGDSSILQVRGSVIDSNAAVDEGGGLSVGLNTAADVTTSSITGNSAGAGGGVSNAGSFSVTNATISSNTATATQGGGLLTSSATTILYSTFSENVATTEGGGIRVIGVPTFSMTGTILFGNTGASGGDCSGPVSGSGFNLVGDTALPCAYTGDPSDAPALSDPMLGTLGFNGETTEHYPLLAGSDAIDAGGACGLLVDQIGAARPDGPACDIGAIEGVSPPPPVLPDEVVLVEPGGRWHIRVPGNPDYTFFYGDPGDIPLFGDWDGDGFDTPGMWRQGPGGGFAYLTNTLPPDGGSANAEFDFFFGDPGDEVFSGDWNGDGIDTLGINRGGHIFLTDTNGSGGLPVPTDYDFWFGDPGDRAFGGDGDGNGKDAVFVYRGTTGLVYWTDQTPVGPDVVAPTTDEFFFGDPADSFVAGDWNADLVDTASIFRSSNTTVYWTNTNASGGAAAPTDGSYVWGTAGWTPVAGVPELP